MDIRDEHKSGRRAGYELDAQSDGRAEAAVGLLVRPLSTSLAAAHDRGAISAEAETFAKWIHDLHDLIASFKPLSSQNNSARRFGSCLLYDITLRSSGDDVLGEADAILCHVRQ